MRPWPSWPPGRTPPRFHLADEAERGASASGARALTAINERDGRSMRLSGRSSARRLRPVPRGKARGMTSIPVPPILLSQAGRAAHDLGLAGLLGGNLFGRLALHPSVTEISDQEERGKVVNAAWKRYGTVNSLSLLAVVTGWAGARAAEARDHRLSDEERPLARAK